MVWGLAYYIIDLLKSRVIKIVKTSENNDFGIKSTYN